MLEIILSPRVLTLLVMAFIVVCVISITAFITERKTHTATVVYKKPHGRKTRHGQRYTYRPRTVSTGGHAGIHTRPKSM